MPVMLVLHYQQRAYALRVDPATFLFPLHNHAVSVKLIVPPVTQKSLADSVRMAMYFLMVTVIGIVAFPLSFLQATMDMTPAWTLLMLVLSASPPVKTGLSEMPPR